MTTRRTITSVFAGFRFPVGAESPVTSCDLGMFVNQAAEPVSPQKPGMNAWGWFVHRSGGRILMECPVRSAGAVMIEVFAQDQPQRYTLRLS